MSLSNVVWVFLIYVWVKKCVKMCEMLFKMLKNVFEMINQIDPQCISVAFSSQTGHKESFVPPIVQAYSSPQP